jgi:hypothetical protein
MLKCGEARQIQKTIMRQGGVFFGAALQLTDAVDSRSSIEPNKQRRIDANADDNFVFG